MAWFELALIAAAPLVGLPFILGMQVSVGSFKGLRQGWIFFLYCGVYFTAMGLVALVISVWRVGLVPHSFEFLVVGVALLSGVGLVRVIFNRQFERRS